MERTCRRERHALQRLAARRRYQSDDRRRPAHHARHDLLRGGKRLRKNFGCAEHLLQLGPAPDQRRLHGRSRRHEQPQTIPFQLTRQYDGGVVVSERPAVRRQPPDRRRGLLPFRRRSVEQIRRGRTQGRALRHRRQDPARGGRLRRFSPASGPVAHPRRRGAHRPSVARRHGVGPAGRPVVPPAARRRAEGFGFEGFPLSDDSRNVHVPAAESRPAAGADVELRSGLFAASHGRTAVLWHQSLLHRR